MSSDREDIIDLMTRYGHFTDTKNYEMFDRVFAPDVVAHYEGFSEDVRGISGMQEFGRKALDPLDATQHLFTNFDITVEGDEGSFRVSQQSAHVRNDAEGGPLFIVAGTYNIRVRRTGDGWRITHLEYAPIWTSGNPALLTQLTG